MSKFEIISVICVSLTLALTLLASIITGTVYIAGLHERVTTLALNPAQIKQETENALKRISDASQEVQRRLTVLEEQGPPLVKRVEQLEQIPLFGQWRPVDANIVYQAQSDGFVMAFAHNKGRFSFWTGSSESHLSERGRITQYQGMMMPVKIGHLL